MRSDLTLRGRCRNVLDVNPSRLVSARGSCSWVASSTRGACSTTFGLCLSAARLAAPARSALAANQELDVERLCGSVEHGAVEAANGVLGSSGRGILNSGLVRADAGLDNIASRSKDLDHLGLGSLWGNSPDRNAIRVAGSRLAITSCCGRGRAGLAGLTRLASCKKSKIKEEGNNLLDLEPVCFNKRNVK
jgi:hypothetical protein